MPVNLDRQIKRHVAARPHLFYTITMPGLEQLCIQELTAVPTPNRILSVDKGGVLWQGKLAALYAASLHLRTTGRILMRLAQFKATNFRHLTHKAAELPWSYFLPRGCLPGCTANCRQSRLYHSTAVSNHLSQVIESYWHDQQIPTHADRHQRLHVRIAQDNVTISLDSSGAGLYQRGIKRHGGPAPLRETMAAAILILADYDPTRPLLDPMCGTGTFSLEAALMAKAIAPGSYRHFAFEQWPSFKAAQWRHLKKKARERTRKLHRPIILASDLNPAACETLSQCVATHHLADAVTVRQHDFFALAARHPDGTPLEPGLVVLNPPYGHRLGPQQDTTALFREITLKLNVDFKGWRVAMLTPQPHIPRQLPFRHRILPLAHGGLQLALILGKIK